MAEKKTSHVVNVSKLIRLVWKRRKTLYKVWAITFVLACVWIFPEPRYYKATVELAPEAGGETMGVGDLSSIASSFGINLGDMQSSDAIYPLLYPELFESPTFLVSLFDIQVETEDDSVKTDYYTYLTEHQKVNPIKKPLSDAAKAVIRWISPKKPSSTIAGENGARFNPFRLSEKDYEIMETVKGNITCTVDKMTNVTTITVQDQDRLVCAMLVDSVRVRLQDFITEYRTSKARLDLEYYEQLMQNAKEEYSQASREYSDYCDSHKDVILQAYIQERDNLENNMSLKFNTYTAMVTQWEAAKAKVQEKTPSFTTLISSTVPVKPAGPKRMFFVIGMLFLSTFITVLIMLRHTILRPLNDE